MVVKRPNETLIAESISLSGSPMAFNVGESFPLEQAEPPETKISLLSR
jgi:hypothetical protein